VDVVRRLRDGPVVGERQDPALVTKAPKLTKEMGLIDWGQPAERVARQVRAMQPWPTAYTFFHRPGREPMRVQLTRVGSLAGFWPPDAGPPTPGALAADPGGLWARAGDGFAVDVRELQPAGKKKMSAAEFLRGHPITAGCRFGPERLP
jgi:methionyl-tRNA formyltransferase